LTVGCCGVEKKWEPSFDFSEIVTSKTQALYLFVDEEKHSKGRERKKDIAEGPNFVWKTDLGV